MLRLLAWLPPAYTFAIPMAAGSQPAMSLPSGSVAQGGSGSDAASSVPGNPGPSQPVSKTKAVASGLCPGVAPLTGHGSPLPWALLPFPQRPLLAFGPNKSICLKNQNSKKNPKTKKNPPKNTANQTRLMANDTEMDRKDPCSNFFLPQPSPPQILYHPTPPSAPVSQSSCCLDDLQFSA